MIGQETTKEELHLSTNEQHPRYVRIAVDIAQRIIQCEFLEMQKIKGRSTLAGEYGVSPETIRRSMALLVDAGVVKVIEKSGIEIKSKNKAYDFLEKFSSRQSISNLKIQIKDLMIQRDKINEEIFDNFNVLLEQISHQDLISKITYYDYKIPKTSHIIGKTISEVQFWQSTGATIIGIQRSDSILVSPGPYFAFENDDIIFFVGIHDAKLKVSKFIEQS